MGGRRGPRTDPRPLPLRHPAWVIGAWATFFLALTPLALGYAHSVNYGSTTAVPSSSESAQANALLASAGYGNSSILVVVNQTGWTSAEAESRTLLFQSDVASAHLPYVASTASAYAPAVDRAEADRFISPDGTVSIVRVLFTVPDSYRTPTGGYPAQQATPEIRVLAGQDLGPSAYVTGLGASAYDAQQLESGAGVLFALVFILLAVAIALTLRSWVAPLVALLLVSLSTVLGYLAIEVTGLIVGKVDFVVTYTLTAVTLGVATDYLLFLVYRFREELARGVAAEEALTTATRTSGGAILVSALTVAVGLGTLSLLGGLGTWGPVLFATVLGIGVMEVTLLPALLKLIGPRIFLRRWLRAPGPVQRSVFYRAASTSVRRPYWVVAAAVAVALPATVAFVAVPTTYDFTGNLPASLPSSQGQALLEEKFGANVLFPVFVIVRAPHNFTLPNGSVSPEASALLASAAGDLLTRPGVVAVAGPYVAGHGVNASAPVGPYLLEDGRAALFTVYTAAGPYAASTMTLVESLRADPAYLVGGVTSAVLDQQAINAVQFPELELLLTLFIGLILGIAFRSIAAPLLSLSGVFLSIGSATALLALIANYVLHQPLIYLVPLILFVILLSLGNDYTVFLLTRIREEQVARGPLEGIRRGIAGNGVVVSALGLILAASLGSLALQPVAFLEQIGIAFVISLLLDTFLVRPFYFPALLGLAERYRDRRRARPVTLGNEAETRAPWRS